MRAGRKEKKEDMHALVKKKKVKTNERRKEVRFNAYRKEGKEKKTSTR